MKLVRRVRHAVDVSLTLATEPKAVALFRRMQRPGLGAGTYFHVLETPPLVYLAIPKAGSSQVLRALSQIARGGDAPPLTVNQLHDRRVSKVPGIRTVGLRAFRRIATSDAALRFAIVRNPYDRLVSAYADKYAGKPLRPGEFYMDQVLAWHARNGRPAPDPATTLDFPAFVDFALDGLGPESDHHITPQSAFLDMAAFPLDIIGRIENFADFAPKIAAHLGIPETMLLAERANRSARRAYADYYDPALTARVRAAYAEDFDRLEYPAALN